MQKHKGSLTRYFYKLQQHHLPLEEVIPIFNQPRGILHPAQRERTNVGEAESKQEPAQGALNAQTGGTHHLVFL